MNNESKQKTVLEVATTLLLTTSLFHRLVFFTFQSSKYEHYLLEFCPLGCNLQRTEKSVSWMYFATAETIMTPCATKFKLQQLSFC